MSEYDFRPNFDKWWNKKDLTEDEASILVFGLNPDQYKKALEIGRGTLGELNQKFFQAFRDYVEGRSQHNHIHRIEEIRQILLGRVDN